MTIEEFVERNGISPTLARGRWKPWSKSGFFVLTSTKDQLHVFPRIWDEVSGTSWVEDLDGKMRYVRVENLKKYKSCLSPHHEELEKKGKVTDLEREEKKRQAAMQRLRDMGIDLADLLS